MHSEAKMWLADYAQAREEAKLRLALKITRHKLRTRESKYLFSNREEDVVNDSLNDTREAKPNENTWQSIVKQRCGAQIMHKLEKKPN